MLKNKKTFKGSIMNLTHIVFKTSKIEETKKFWESTFSVENRSEQEDFLSYKIGTFVINFSNDSSASLDFKSVISHIGIEFDSVSRVDEEYRKVLTLHPDTKKPIGGKGEGPYRFYLKDPNEIVVEVETWEGCSD